MTYDNVSKERFVVPVAFDLSASVSALFTWKLGAKKSFVIKDVYAVYTEASGPATTAGVLSVGYKAAGGSEVEQLTITDAGAAIGDEVGPDTALKASTEIVCGAGDTIYFRLKTQASSGTTTGAGYFVVDMVNIPL